MSEENKRDDFDSFEIFHDFECLIKLASCKTIGSGIFASKEKISKDDMVLIEERTKRAELAIKNIHEAAIVFFNVIKESGKDLPIRCEPRSSQRMKYDEFNNDVYCYGFNFFNPFLSRFKKVLNCLGSNDI